MVATTFDMFVLIITILINILVLCISAHTLLRRNRQTITTPTTAEPPAASENTEPDVTIISCDESLEDMLYIHFHFNEFYRLSKTESTLR